MKILWIVNIVMPDLAERLHIPVATSGSWLVNMAKGIAESGNTLAIACVYGKEYDSYEINGVKYYTLPGNGKNMLFYTKKYEKLWHRVFDDFKPDIVNIHGTEYSHGLSFMREFPSVPTVVSLQGILNRIKDVDFAGIPKRYFIFGKTLKQWLKFNGEFENHFIHKKNAKHEREMLARASAVCGVNTWDTSIARSINPDAQIYKIEYDLRDGYYNSDKWDLTKVNRHTIFTNPGGTPLKGLHILLQAVAILKDKYPAIKIIVPGMQGLNGNVKITGAYSRYLNKLIKKLNLVGHIEFLGKQSEEQMIQNVLSSHITVIPSAIEGTSLILREAMYLGCPCIASFRGGMADFISDKADGFLYDFPEYPYLATRIEQLFDSDELCKAFSVKAIEKAAITHEKGSGCLALLNIYKAVLSYKING